jgi:hypothetical protein
LKSCKRAVLRRFPKAFCLFFSDGDPVAKYEVWLSKRDGGQAHLFVRGPTAHKAWEFAAAKLKI